MSWPAVTARTWRSSCLKSRPAAATNTAPRTGMTGGTSTVASRAIMSVSVMMPTISPFSTTGTPARPCSAMMRATVGIESSGDTVGTSRRMISVTNGSGMDSLPCPLERGRLLRDGEGQVGRDQTERADPPLDAAGGATADVDGERGGIEGRQPLRQKGADAAGEDVARAGGCQRGRRLRRDRGLPAVRDGGVAIFEDDDLIPDPGRLAHGFQRVGDHLARLLPAQACHLARVRRQYRLPRLEPLPPFVLPREPVQTVGVNHQMLAAERRAGRGAGRSRLRVGAAEADRRRHRTAVE